MSELDSDELLKILQGVESDSEYFLNIEPEDNFEEADSMPLQEGYRDMQLQLQQHHPGSEAQPIQADRVPGGVAAHPQHPRHEDPAHHPRHAAQPARPVRAVALRRPLLRGLPRFQRRGRGADLRRRAPERQVRDQRARQPAGGAGVVHVRAAPGHGVRARHRDPRVRRARAHAPLRVPARRQALRVHRVPGLQRVRRLPGGHVQHRDRARVPAGRGGGRARARARGRARRRAGRLDGLAVQRRVGRRGLPAGAGGRRAGAGPRLRRRAPAAHGLPRRGRNHQRAARAAPAGGDGAGRAVRVLAGRGRGRRVRAAAPAPVPGGPGGGAAAGRVRAVGRTGCGAGDSPARALRPAGPRALPAHAQRARRALAAPRAPGAGGGPVDLRNPRGPFDLRYPHVPVDLRDPHGPLDLRDPHGPFDLRDPHGPFDLRDPHGPFDLRDPHGPFDLHDPAPDALYIMCKLGTLCIM